MLGTDLGKLNKDKVVNRIDSRDLCFHGAYIPVEGNRTNLSESSNVYDGLKK